MNDKEEYQAVITELANNFAVPSIEVVVVDKLCGCKAIFYSDSYTIYIEAAAPKKYLFHEFAHYLMALVAAVETVEETLADYVMEALEEESKLNYPLIKSWLKKRPRKTTNKDVGGITDGVEEV